MKQLKPWMIMILRYDNEVCYFIMQSKNIHNFSHEMNWICICSINNLKTNDKYNDLIIYICYNIFEEKTYGSC